MAYEEQLEIINLLHKGSNQAYQWLYKKYYVALRNLAVYYTKDSEAASDLVQDSFFALLESNKQFESLDQVRYFLYAVLKNKCISYVRRIKTREQEEGALIIHLQEMNDYWDRVLEEDVFTHLIHAIDSLPPQCKLVMQLSLEGLKIAEIAQKLQISSETVKEHRANGKKKLAKWMKNKNIIQFLIFLLNF